MSIPSIGAMAKLGMGSSSPVTEAYEFLHESVRASRTILDTSGIRGTRSHAVERTRTGTYSVAGRIVLQPTPEELAHLLPRILGAAASGTNYAVAETLPDFYLSIDRGAKVFTYAGCKIVKATFFGNEGSPIELRLDLVGKTESVANAGTFPAISPSLTAPYVFTDGVLTLQSLARQFREFELTIDNVAQTGRYMNGLTVSEIPIVDRVVTLRTVHPYTADETDLYQQALAGAAGSLAWTNGGYSTTFSFASLQCPAESPVVTGKGEVGLALTMTARSSGTTKEIVVAHDSTP